MNPKKAHLLRYAHPSSLRRSAATPLSSGFASLASGTFFEFIAFFEKRDEYYDY
jgi:hypothetical protein